MVRLRSLSPRSNRITVSGETFAAAANFLALRPMAALAMRHCTGSTSEPLHSLLGSAVPQRDYTEDESAAAYEVENEQSPSTAKHTPLNTPLGLKRAERARKEMPLTQAHQIVG